ncbi:2'-5' RNA ligase family protein [Rubeoparvulum massiliense]|uniref:2'-5' RNA ligase family protein n=1 Tax=Rubeoparvulum massiliense TaxID=1631346 RepID=UPI00065DD753|nr:2'-5' RNA ligase family protein [Rubeoparvulum massiliense]
MKYSVVIFPSEEIRSMANSLRKRYDSYFHQIEPYVTLLDPFTLTDEERQSSSSFLEAVAKDTEAFSLTFHKVGTFHPVTPIVYLAIQEKDALHHLHQRLSNGPIQVERKYSFVPHLTVARDLAEGELLDVYGRLRLRSFQLACIINQFHLIKQTADGTWQVDETFLL